MPITQHSKRITPKIANSELYISSLGSANDVDTLEVPAGAVAVSLWFDNSGTVVSGRVGFAGEVSPTFTSTSAGDDTSGHQTGVETYSIPSWAKVLHVSSSTADAKVFGMWFYD